MPRRYLDYAGCAMPNYSFNATVTCRGDNPAHGAARKL
jgi:hypothetical protein